MPSANVVQTSVSGGQQNALALQGDGVFLPKLSTATRTALTLGTSDKGFLAYDTTDNNVYIWNGAAWESIPASGDAGANGAVQYNDNGIIAGAANLFWDKANNRLGVGTASPGVTFDVAGPIRSIVSGGTPFLYLNNGVSQHSLSNDSNALSISVFAAEQMRIAASGVFTFYDGAGGTRMILNSTGLGIGTTVLGGNKLAIGSTSDTSATANGFNIITNRATITTTCNGAVDAAGTTINYSWANGGQGPLIFRNAAFSNVMTLDASGQVGIGVTPSALTNVTRLEIGGQLSSNVTLRSTSTSASARNWMVAANAVSFGDFVIRQGNSQGAEPNSGTDRLYIDPSGNLILQSSATPATLTTNGQLTVNATSNTNLRFSYRGSDGVTRVANITLA